MSWENILKDEKQEIRDALSMLKHMVEKNPRYKGDFLLEKIIKYLEGYLDREELQ